MVVRDKRCFRKLILLFKGIISILDQNLDHGNFVYICMELKEGGALNGHAVMSDTYIMYLI